MGSDEPSRILPRKLEDTMVIGKGCWEVVFFVCGGGWCVERRDRVVFNPKFS